MSDCDNRQLTQDQREDGFQQSAPVARAIRPFPTIQFTPQMQSNPLLPVLKSLIDYINRDMLPVMQPVRNRINESYPAVQRNAPSGNPLTYVMDPSTDASCPGPGFARFNAAPQSDSTIVRLSNQNQLKQDTVPWTTLMANSATAPLGVVTISDAFAPQNYIRADVNSVTAGASCAELGVTPFEGSSTSPIGAGRQVVVSFIPGVAGASVPVLAPGATPTWAQTLAAGNGSGGSQPTIINSDSLLFAAGSLGIEAASDLSVNVTDALTLESGTDMHLHATGQLHLGHETLTASIHQGAVGDIEVVTSGAYSMLSSGNASVNAGGNTQLTAGGFFGIGTNGSTRIIIDATGAWALDGTTPGTSGQFLRSSGSGAEPTWATVTVGSLAAVASDTFLGNISGSSVAPSAVPLANIDSASIIYDATSHSFQRAALTGDITAVQNGNSTVISTHAVTNAKLAQMGTDTFKGNISGATANAADVLIVSLASASIAYDNITTHTFQRAALTGDVTAGINSNATTIANSAVTNAKMANMPADTVKCNPSGVSAAPSDLAINAQGVVGRTSGDLQSIDSATQTALIRGSGSVFWASASANQALCRSGSGDLGFSSLPLTALATQAANTFVANATGSTAAPTAISEATATSMLNTFTSTLQGVVPASGGGTINFMRADGSWASPPSALPSIANNTVLGNISGGTATASAVALSSFASTSIVNSGSTFQRAALTGDVTASQNSNATTINAGITPTWTGQHIFNGNVLIGGQFRITDIQSVTLSGAVNNQSIGANTTVLRLTGTGGSLTGMVAASAQQVILIANATSGTVVIPRESTNSTAANRFSGTSSIGAGNLCIAWYDGTAGRWVQSQ